MKWKTRIVSLYQHNGVVAQRLCDVCMRSVGDTKAWLYTPMHALLTMHQRVRVCGCAQAV
jgi:hypothetical protein